MGDLFDAKYYQRSIDAFQLLLHEYPTGKYREDALLAIAQIEQDDLHDSALAQKTYQQFLTLHPRSPHAAEVRASIDKLNGLSVPQKPSLSISTARDQADRVTSKTISAEKTPPATDTKPGSPESYSGGFFRAASLPNSHLERRYLFAHRDRCGSESEISGRANCRARSNLFRYRRRQTQFLTAQESHRRGRRIPEDGARRAIPIRRSASGAGSESGHGLFRVPAARSLSPGCRCVRHARRGRSRRSQHGSRAGTHNDSGRAATEG